MTERTALYRLYDAQDRLLYVGITKNLKQRWDGHRHSATSSKWWPQVSRTAIEWHPTLEAADAAETAAIASEKPLHNKAKRPGGWSAKPSRLSPELNWSTRLEDPYSEQAARILQGEIQAGIIQPGDSMPTAKELHERFGLSVATCGGILQSLASRGVVHQRSKGSRYYCSRPGEVVPLPSRKRPKVPTPQEIAALVRTAAVEGIPVNVVERRTRSNRRSQMLLGAQLQMRPYSPDPERRKPHVNVELSAKEVIEFDADGLAQFIGQLEAQCEVLRELHGRLLEAEGRRAA